ncbi:MAG: hypothetical protein VX913_15215, partial [Planctomycetota bacterium]|nr:hypothetical protein [Planctomycetota bacterium]
MNGKPIAITILTVLIALPAWGQEPPATTVTEKKAQASTCCKDAATTVVKKAQASTCCNDAATTVVKKAQASTCCNDAATA